MNFPVKPDGFFEVANLPNQESWPTLLEVDMSEEQRTTHWIPKIHGHLDIQGGLCEDYFGFRHPSILVVALTEARARLLKKWTEGIIKARKGWGDHQQLFYFTWFEHKIDPKTKMTVGMDANELLFTPRYLVGGSDEPTFLFSR